MLRGVRVGDVMAWDCAAVAPATDLRSLVDDQLLRTDRCVVVQSHGHVLGLVTAKKVRRIDRSKWPHVPVRDVRPLEQLRTVTPEARLRATPEGANHPRDSTAGGAARSRARAGCALVRIVEHDSPAEKAGIEPGDVIVQYNNQAVEESRDLVRMVSRTEPGATVPIQVVRAKERKALQVTIAALESEDIGSQSSAIASAWGLTFRELERGIEDTAFLLLCRDAQEPFLTVTGR